MAIEQGGTADVLTNPTGAATEAKQDDIIANQPSSLGDGDAIDLQDEDGTVGTTKGTLIHGIDDNNEARPISVTDGAIRVIEGSNHLLKEILTALRINNKYLHQITGDRVDEIDTEINR